MFKKIHKTLKDLEALSQRKTVDPSVFNDELALKTSWTPLCGGGTNIRTHKLVLVSPDRAEFHITIGNLFFCFVFFAAGAACFVLSVRDLLASLSVSLLGGAFVGLLFMTVGIVMFYFTTTPVVFDKQRGYFWKTRRSPETFIYGQQEKGVVALNRVRALQIIGEFCRGGKTSFHSYELNLILDDSSRVNVVDHGHYAELRADAEKIAQFLEKPLWNAAL